MSTFSGGVETLSVFLNAVVWAVNYGHAVIWSSCPHPFSPQCSLSSLPNFPGFHHCLGLYGNKRRRRRQQFLFSLLLIAPWLPTKCTFKLKHILNNVISNMCNKNKMARCPNSSKYLKPSRNKAQFGYFQGFCLLFVCNLRGVRKRAHTEYFHTSMINWLCKYNGTMVIYSRWGGFRGQKALPAKASQPAEQKQTHVKWLKYN